MDTSSPGSAAVSAASHEALTAGITPGLHIAPPEASAPAIPLLEAVAHRRTRGERTRKRDSAYRRALAVSDALTALLACTAAIEGWRHSSLRPLAILTPIAVVAAAKLLGLYDNDSLALRRSTLDEVPALFSLATVCALTLWLAQGLLVHGAMWRVQVAVAWVVLLVGATVGRTLARAALRRGLQTERCMLIGSEDLWDRLSLSMSLRSGLELATYFPLRTRAGGRFEPLGQAIFGARHRLRAAAMQHHIHRVIIALRGADEHDENMLDGVFALEQLGLKVSVVPHMLEVVGSAGQFEDLDGLPVLGVGRFGLSRSSQQIKRLFDLVLGGALLLCCAPLMAALALAVKLSSPGPILFRQPRVGFGGDSFEMLKFRTMHDGAEAQQAALAVHNETRGLFKLSDDPRVTRVGRALRRSSLDELPQLLNVIRGDMSLVGPRPLIPAEDALVSGWARRRLELAPGITGPWQILDATRVPLTEMVKIDYLYIANWSPWADVKAILRTLPHVFGRHGL